MPVCLDPGRDARISLPSRGLEMQSRDLRGQSGERTIFFFLIFVLGVLTHGSRSCVHEAVNWLRRKRNCSRSHKHPPLVSCLENTASRKGQTR